jgi:DNA-binding response OmpR family regulator
MKSLLIAISNNDLSALVCEFLQEKGFQVVTASSLDESVKFVKSRHLDGIVMTADWAVEETGCGTETLMGLAKDNIPTVTIIEKNSYDILDVVYPSAMHQFVTTPFGSDELFARLERAMQNKKK